MRGYHLHKLAYHSTYMLQLRYDIAFATLSRHVGQAGQCETQSRYNLFSYQSLLLHNCRENYEKNASGDGRDLVS
jgi:hypothetical protein